MTDGSADGLRASRRLAWFCDLEALVENLAVLRLLRDEIGLTTLVPESHRCHTSGFAPSPAVVAVSPLEGWRASPTLAQHRQNFHLDDAAFAVLPGIVGGFDDTPLLRVIEECRRLGLEIWGHAGLWCYGGEVFPDLAARDVFDRPLPASSQEWGIGFCPSKPALHDWITASLVDVARRYDLDGFFLDHARYPSPGDGAALLTCGCADCAREAARRGYDMAAFRDGLLALRARLAELPPAGWEALANGGSVASLTLLAGHAGALDWLLFRARLLADQFAAIGAAVRAATGRPLPFGSDVFPPSVGLLGGHLYQAWASGATYLTGGFGGRIGWSTVGAVTIDHLSPWLCRWAPGLDPALAARVVARLLGYDTPALGLQFDARGRVDDPGLPLRAHRHEMRQMAAAAGGLPVYPPVSAGLDADALGEVCRGIIAAGLDGAMFSGLDRLTADLRAVVRRELSSRLL
jgi:hypothetical protein